MKIYVTHETADEVTLRKGMLSYKRAVWVKQLHDAVLLALRSYSIGSLASSYEIHP
jgi:hypothetical protein